MTINQLIRIGRTKVKRIAKAPVLNQNPQRSAVCVRVTTIGPKKPNSANRKVAKVRFRDGMERWVYIPGEKHNIQEHSRVLIRGGKTQDLNGFKIKVIRGPKKYDVNPTEGRKNKRSKYGVSNPNKKARG